MNYLPDNRAGGRIQRITWESQELLKVLPPARARELLRVSKSMAAPATQVASSRILAAQNHW